MSGRQTPVAVSVREVSKRFGRFAALDGVSLEVRPGELVALLGPSGSGKTTLLRVLAGLEAPDEGRVHFDGEDVTDASAAARRVGFVFQQYALFRHMTVARNISFGLDVRRRGERPSRVERDRRVADLLKLVELEGLGGRRPSQLSGGQRQRVALARALAVEPRMLLLDEPFGALDASVRKALRRELRRLHDRTGLTTVFVTHDQAEALELADRVAILNRGRIEQVATPGEALAEPASAFVAGFVGEANRMAGEVRGGLFRRAEAQLPAPGLAEGPATAFVRPSDLKAAPSGAPGLSARVLRVLADAAGPRLECRDGVGGTWEATPVDPADPPVAGAEVFLQLRAGRVFPDVAAG